MTHSIIMFAAAAAACAIVISGHASAQHDNGAGVTEEAAPSNSLLAQSLKGRRPDPAAKDNHALRLSSQFAVPPPKPREFARHDLVQIIVKENSTARSEQSLETEKEYEIGGKISKLPAFMLPDLLELQLRNSTSTPIELDLEAEKSFEGDGEYERRDDLSARVTAEVIDILPNGNLVLEARTTIATDDESSTIKVTGICRPQDVTAVNTVLSNQLHDLSIEKMHEGELRKSAEKGLIAKVLDALFAF